MEMLRGAVVSWRKNVDRRRRLKRAPELIMRAHLLMKDREIRTLKRQLAEQRERTAGLEVQVYEARRANEDLIWARLKRAGLDRLEESETPMAIALDQVARQGIAA